MSVAARANKLYGSRTTNSWAPCLVWWATVGVGFLIFGWPGAAFAAGALTIGGLGAIYNGFVRGKLRS